MIRLLISEDKIKNLIFDIYCRLHEGWTSAREFDYKDLLSRYDFPVTGRVGKECMVWLQDNHYVEFRNHGRAGCRFRWPSEIEDINSVVSGFILHLRKLDSTDKSIISYSGRIKPKRFEPGDKVYLLFNNKIIQRIINSVNYGLVSPITYTLKDIDESNKFYHESLFVSIDDLLNHLRSNVEFLKSDDTK